MMPTQCPADRSNQCVPRRRSRLPCLHHVMTKRREQLTLPWFPEDNDKRPRTRNVPIPEIQAAHFRQRHDFLGARGQSKDQGRSEEHTSELQSLMRISYAVFCLKKKNKNKRR